MRSDELIRQGEPRVDILFTDYRASVYPLVLEIVEIENDYSLLIKVRIIGSNDPKHVIGSVYSKKLSPRMRHCLRSAGSKPANCEGVMMLLTASRDRGINLCPYEVSVVDPERAKQWRAKMQTEDKPVIPNGYWERADGMLVPLSKITDIDKERTKVVTELCRLASVQSALIADFKAKATDLVLDFVAHSMAEYKVKHGGKKGNITLISFDGKYKVVRQMQETLVFDERLQAAKALIDECIIAWSKTTNANITVLVKDAFQVDKAGKIDTQRVLGLRRLKIEDPKWQRAMQAIGDSIQVSGTKPYIRFYEKNEAGDYVAISLDMAVL